MSDPKMAHSPGPFIPVRMTYLAQKFLASGFTSWLWFPGFAVIIVFIVIVLRQRVFSLI